MKRQVFPEIAKFLLAVLTLHNSICIGAQIRERHLSDPCAGICGKNTDCVVYKNLPYCYCKPGFEFDGYRCSPDQKPPTPKLNPCNGDSFCPKDRECRDGDCVNPCEDFSCGTSTICIVRHHKPSCMAIRRSIGSEKFLKKRFMIPNVTLTWERALSYCWNHGMNLATIENNQENTQLEELLNNLEEKKDTLKGSKNFVYHALPIRRLKFILHGLTTSSSGNIILTGSPYTENPLLLINIGSTDTTKTEFRRDWESPSSAEFRARRHPNVVPDDKSFQAYWISYGGGIYEVGVEREVKPFAKWKDPLPFHISYYGLPSGSDPKIEWIIDGEIHRSNKDSKDIVYRPLPQYALDVQVLASKDLHIVLTSGEPQQSPQVEIFLGGLDNTVSSIRYSKDETDKVYLETDNLLSPSEVKHFRISWKNGLIQVKTGLDRKVLMAWQNHDFFDVTHFGIRAPKGSSVNYTVVNEVTGLVHVGQTWLGARDYTKNKKFMWSNSGSKLNYTNWATGKGGKAPKRPANAYDMGCLSTRPNMSVTGGLTKWDNLFCLTDQTFVCQYYDLFVYN